MENVMIIAGAIAVVAIMFAMFAVHSVYGGKHASLCDAKVGEVFNFEYLQPLNGDAKRVLAKVVEPVVLRVAIPVAYLLAFRARTQEGFRNKDMNIETSMPAALAAAFGKINPDIAVFVNRSCQDPAGLDIADVTFCADFIGATEVSFLPERLHHEKMISANCGSRQPHER